MIFPKSILRNIMRRGNTTNENDTESESADDEVTESEESVSIDKKVLGIPFYKLTHKRLPRKCLKFSFLLLNGMTFLAGITAVVISVWMLCDSKLMSRMIGQRLFVTILLFIGIFVSLMTFTGILTIAKRKRKFLNIYISCHVLSLCIIFICSVMSFSFFDKITKKIQEDMYGTIINYRSLDWVTEAWDNTHKYLECCGIISSKDWSKHNMNIPHSCCSTSIDKCLNMSESVAYQSGCLKGALHLLKSHVHTVAMSALFASVVLVAGLFLAFQIRKKFRIRRTVTD